MYTIALVNTDGNMLINTTQDAIPGKVIVKGEFFTDSDLRFSIKGGGSEASATAGCSAENYPTVVINGKTWLAKNLNCKLPDPREQMVLSTK